MMTNNQQTKILERRIFQAMKKTVAVIGSICVVVALIALPIASCAEPTPTGGILKISHQAAAVTLGDPLPMSRADDLFKAGPAIETLIHYDETGAPMPWLATSWEVDAEAKTIVLHLREGVKFHDGSDFNAEVVKWNFERYMATGRAELRTVESVDVIDDHTVRINLSSYDSLIITNLGIYPGMMISKESFETYGEEWAGMNPVGTGPFKFVSWEKDVSVKFEKFDDYWQEGKPYLDAIEFHIIGDPLVRMAAFQAGEEDIVMGLDPKDARYLEEKGEYVIRFLGSGMHLMSGDAMIPGSPYADIKVRQAIEYAIDKQALCEVFGYGYWTPLNRGMARPGGWADNTDVVGYPYNPEKARELLAEAGYPDGFKTTLFTRVAPIWNQNFMTAVAGFFIDVGIDTEVEPCERGRENIAAVKGGWEDGIWNWTMGLYAPDELMTINRLMARGGILFVSKYVASEFQDVLEEAVAAPDFETKARLTRELQYLMVDKYAMVTWLNQTGTPSARYPEIHDEGISIGPGSVHWTPEDAWIDE